METISHQEAERLLRRGLARGAKLSLRNGQAQTAPLRMPTGRVDFVVELPFDRSHWEERALSDAQARLATLYEAAHESGHIASISAAMAAGRTLDDGTKLGQLMSQLVEDLWINGAWVPEEFPAYLPVSHVVARGSAERNDLGTLLEARGAAGLPTAVLLAMVYLLNAGWFTCCGQQTTSFGDPEVDEIVRACAEVAGSALDGDVDAYDARIETAQRLTAMLRRWLDEHGSGGGLEELTSRVVVTMRAVTSGEAGEGPGGTGAAGGSDQGDGEEAGADGSGGSDQGDGEEAGADGSGGSDQGDGEEAGADGSGGSDQGDGEEAGADGSGGSDQGDGGGGADATTLLEAAVEAALEGVCVRHLDEETAAAALGQGAGLPQTGAASRTPPSGEAGGGASKGDGSRDVVLLPACVAPGVGRYLLPSAKHARISFLHLLSPLLLRRDFYKAPATDGKGLDLRRPVEVALACRGLEDRQIWRSPYRELRSADALDLVVLLDTSGSMTTFVDADSGAMTFPPDHQNRYSFAAAAAAGALGATRAWPRSRGGVVGFGNRPVVGVPLASIARYSDEELCARVVTLRCYGGTGTTLSAGLAAVRRCLGEGRDARRIGVVVVLTDGQLVPGDAKRSRERVEALRKQDGAIVLAIALPGSDAAMLASLGCDAAIDATSSIESLDHSASAALGGLVDARQRVAQEAARRRVCVALA
ncbi:MAG: VWA domain-containing protein [Actinomycetota bacterium]|nr:VWA domain-containing protein [Actinomycetota bacterium]